MGRPPSSLPHNPTLQIVELCLKIDEAAELAYQKLADRATSPELREFWATMRKEEAKHVEFWKKVCASQGGAHLPQIFYSPADVISELRELLPKAQTLLDRCHQLECVQEAFLAAFRLEFYLLHPAFETLFQFLRSIVDEPCPGDEYENHIEHFIAALNRYGSVTPAMELLGETLLRLWHENKLLAERATRDALTGCLTRQAFMEIARHFASLAHRTGRSMAVMMIDLDYFKQVNDRFGHQTGDLVLQEAALCIHTNLRPSDVVCRYGGEEFLVCVPEVNLAKAIELAERIRTQFASRETAGVKATMSIGVTAEAIPEDNSDEALVRMIDQADHQLYKAKQLGRNRVVS